jgi:hypothetical protein
MSSASKNLLNFLISNHIDTDFQSDQQLEAGLLLQWRQAYPKFASSKRNMPNLCDEFSRFP